ncbi:phage antirepressor [Olsenella uli]|uniref:phage antirepressor n=1 Tax=Olsenella uli TaxID=133926 RepID=UPI003D79A57D
MNEIQTFDSPEFGTIRAVRGEDGEPMFVAKDVCAALEVKNSRDALARLDDDEKGVVLTDTPGGEQQMQAVNEAGLYVLVLGSRKPEARAFKRWVTHEVLPALRRDGGYMVARDETPEETMARALLLAQGTMERQKRRIAGLEAENEAMRPKALFADAVAASDGTCLVGEFAKMLRQNGVEVGQNRLFAMLREDGYLGNVGQNRNVPTQRAMDLGLFRIKETAVTHSDGHVTINRTPKVTGKGQIYFVKRYGA